VSLVRRAPVWVLYALGSAFFAGLTALFGKAAVLEMDPDLVAVLRTVVVLVLLGGVALAKGAWRRPDAFQGRAMFFIVLSGAATGLSWLCYYRALRAGPLSRVAPIDKLSVAAVMILAALFLGETVSWRAAAGAALIVAGAVLVAVG
jgi:transporter family protein